MLLCYGRLALRVRLWSIRFYAVETYVEFGPQSMHSRCSIRNITLAKDRQIHIVQRRTRNVLGMTNVYHLRSLVDH
jgi:hypothetical protein